MYLSLSLSLSLYIYIYIYTHSYSYVTIWHDYGIIMGIYGTSIKKKCLS